MELARRAGATLHEEAGSVTADRPRGLLVDAIDAGQPIEVCFGHRRYGRVDDWLAELEESGLLEYVPLRDKADGPLEFRTAATEPAPPLVLEEDQRRISDQSWAAGNVLSIAGAYVADERVKVVRARVIES